MPRPTIAERLAARSVRVANGCLLWQGYVDPGTGYGIIGDGQKLKKVHRVAWEVAYGPLPTDTSYGARGTLVCHTCDVRHCIEPTHLWLGTQKENMADARAKGRQKPPAGWNKGIPHSPETRAKIAAAAQLRPPRRSTPESRRKMSEARKAWWARRP